MRFEVPQFIEVEDKIVGPLTWKQFIYVAGAAGIGLVLYLTLPFFFFILFAVPVVALAGFLAFHQINNRPFSIFLESATQYMLGTKLYLWKKQTPQTILARKKNIQRTPTPTETSLTPQGNIASLATKLELNTLEK